MKALVVMALLFAVLAAAESDSASKEYLKQIESADFGKVVLESPHVWLIHNAEGEASSSILSELAKVANALGGVFHVGYVQSAEGLTTGATYFYGDQKSDPVQYTGEAKLTDMVKFVLANTKQLIDARSKAARQLKDHQEYLKREAERADKEASDEAKLREKSDTIVLTTSAFHAMLKLREPYAVNVYVANCSDCIQLNKEWQGVSTQLKGLVKVAKLNLTENEELEEVLKIQQFPTVLFYPAGVKKVDGALKFSGTKKKFSLVEWLVKNNQENTGKSELEELTAENYKQVCKGGKGTCVIAFLENTDDEEVVKGLTALAGSYLKKPVSFFYALKSKQEALAKQFGVQTYPNVLMTYCHRKTFWKLDELNLKKLEDAVGEVLLGNRNNFVKYKFEETVA